MAFLCFMPGSGLPVPPAAGSPFGIRGPDPARVEAHLCPNRKPALTRAGSERSVCTCEKKTAAGQPVHVCRGGGLCPLRPVQPHFGAHGYDRPVHLRRGTVADLLCPLCAGDGRAFRGVFSGKGRSTGGKRPQTAGMIQKKALDNPKIRGYNAFILKNPANGTGICARRARERRPPSESLCGACKRSTPPGRSALEGHFTRQSATLGPVTGP